MPLCQYFRTRARNRRRIKIAEAIDRHQTHVTVSFLFFAAGATPGLKTDLDDGGGTSDSRLSEQEEEAIAMSMVPAGS